MKTRAKRAGDEYFRGIKRRKHEKLVEDSFSVSIFMKNIKPETFPNISSAYTAL